MTSKMPDTEAGTAAGVPRVRALLATRVKALREASGATLYGLARRAEIHGTYLRQIEEGSRNPSLEQLVRLAAAFDLRSLDELIGPLPLDDVLRSERDRQAIRPTEP